MAKSKQKEISLKREGTLFVISAPSGTGKTTICRKLLKKHDTLKLSVSYTTRPPRKGEKSGIDYTFVTKEKFKKMIDRGEFAEWAMVYGNFYGTAVKRLKQLNKAGYDIILDIDTRGAMQLKNTYDNAVYVFILPPSMQTLKDRLISRKTETADIVKKRLESAREEISFYGKYDYIIINDILKYSCQELESIILATKTRIANTDQKLINKLLK
ncbi:guanylate kinase [bacterium BMS3Abin09]|nr:guanylate kinase [bacterium BMS3Abin09]GBE41583.1 guanylate kinase [bacterium BMS3Bbin09]